MTRREPSPNPRRIVLERLRALCVAGTTFARPEDAVAWLGAVQAQDYLSALWAVGLRLARATELDVEAALANGSVVRTWPMRGTLHFVAAADARWLTELLAPRAVSAAASRLTGFGIDAALLKRARTALTRRLRDEHFVARPDIYRTLEDAGIATSSERGLHVLWRLAHECFVCCGPRVGKQPSFALFERWLPKAPRLTGDEALATLAVRYFRSHGPATARDLAWWSGLTLAEARRAAHAAGNALRRTAREREEYLEDPVRPSPSRSRSHVHVLPAFDELLVGYAHGGTFVDAAVTQRVRSGGRIHPAVISAGRVVGTWARSLGSREVSCRVTAFERLNPADERRVEQALERYARFVGRTLRLQVIGAQRSRTSR